MNSNIFMSLLLLLFIALKLTDYIDWSWGWVLSPFWIPLSIGIVGAIIYFVALAFETPKAKAARLLREYADALRRKP